MDHTVIHLPTTMKSWAACLEGEREGKKENRRKEDREIVRDREEKA